MESTIDYPLATPNYPMYPNQQGPQFQTELYKQYMAPLMQNNNSNGGKQS
jgi:hypothetical protein